MYIFVRFTAVVTILFGIFMMLAGAGGAIYGFFQNEAVTSAANLWAETVTDTYRIINAGYAAVLLGTMAFIIGMISAAVGQLLLVFVDLAVQARETNLILRSFRPRSAAKPGSVENSRDDEKDEVYG
ncbi:MAG: hypothetical protein RBS68_02755 [Anaerolineales bacterium]|jgi:hypothetical protein|nr:hypothetical protein [Anaerolineales bacterium]